MTLLTLRHQDVKGGRSMTEPNYFAVNRSLTQSDFWLSEEFTKPQAWIDLISLSRHSDGFATIRGIEIELKRGQNCWSELKLSQRWKWSRNKVRRFLKTLEVKHQILMQKTNVTTVMTIVNYDIYQPSSLANETPSETPERHQTKHQKDIRKTRSNNDKNDKNEKTNPDLSLLPAEAVSIANIIIDHVKELNPSAKNISDTSIEKTRFSWASDIDKMNRLDGRKFSDIQKVFEWSSRDSFWSSNILSGSKLRQKYDDLFVRMTQQNSSRCAYELKTVKQSDML